MTILKNNWPTVYSFFCFLLSKWLQRKIFQNLLYKRCQMKRRGNISGDSKHRLFSYTIFSFFSLKSFVFGIFMSTITFGGFSLSCFEGFAFAFTTFFKSHFWSSF